MLTACASGPRVVYQDRLIEVPVPVRAPLDAALTADCPPATDIAPAGPLPVADALRRLAAVEDALLECRLRLLTLRNLSN